MGQYEAFKREMEDMEQRLGQIVCLAFDNCSGCESVLKVHTNARAHTHAHTHTCLHTHTVAGDDGSADREAAGPQRLPGQVPSPALHVQSGAGPEQGYLQPAGLIQQIPAGMYN